MNLYLKTAKSTIIICCLFILQTATFAQSNIRITIGVFTTDYYSIFYR